MIYSRSRNDSLEMCVQPKTQGSILNKNISFMQKGVSVRHTYFFIVHGCVCVCCGRNKIK